MFFTQVSLLIWKNFTLQKRSLCMTFGEILLPSVFTIILLILKKSSTLTYFDTETFNAQPLFWHNPPSVIGYVPENSATKEVTEWIINTQKQYYLLFGQKNATASTSKGFETIHSALNYYTITDKPMNLIIEFVGLDVSTKLLPNNVTVILHPYRKALNSWTTDRVHMLEFQINSRSFIQFDQDFAFTQSLVNKAILAHWLKSSNKSKDLANFELLAKRFPLAQHYVDGMYMTIKLQLSLFMVLGFMMNVFVYTKNIVSEKELKIKETMKLMGMKLTAFWLSWFITYLICIVPAIVFYTIALGVDLTGKGPILKYSDPLVVFTLLISYGLALISFSFMVTCLVQKGSDGAIIAGLLFLAEYVPYEIISQKYYTFTNVVKFTSCLLFNIALGLSNYNIARREAREEGIQWNNFDKPIANDDFTVKDSILMLLIDTLMHLILTWYLDNVFPGDYGVPKPVHFFLTKSYWCKNHDPTSYQSEEQTTDPKYFEKEPDKNIGIRIVNLRKEFGNKVSVADVNLNIFEGQITVLLGHNGAGKTTTMSILTGLMPPTKGTAFINGFDICKNIGAVRQSLGLCPQHDILFDALTCKEHLWFFTKMKGYKSADLKKEMKEMLRDLGLEHKQNAVVNSLSGGQKRCLSVAIALMGGSKIVFLDEPSSGMDPSTRRRMWDVVQNNRAGRTIILSTHYMDEADSLGDRIAIMARGSVQCCGTSMFLKKLYGTGYHLVIVKGANCDIDLLTQEIVSHIPLAVVESVVSMEISYLLPETECENFPQLFRSLNAKKKMLNIMSFGTSATTMEEVFLKSEEESDVMAVESAKMSFVGNTLGDKTNVLDFNSGFTLNSGITLLIQQFKALVIKRFMVAKKQRISTLLSYTIPSMLVLLFYVTDKAFGFSKKIDPLLMLDIKMYGNGIVVPVTSDKQTEHFKEEYKTLTGTAIVKDITETGNSLDSFLLTSRYQVGPVGFDHRYILGAEFVFNRTLRAIALYNGQPFHSLFVSIDLIFKAVIKQRLGPSYHITMGLLPLEKLGEVDLQQVVFDHARSGFFVGMFIGIGMTLFSSITIHYVLREKKSGVKHMQSIFGVSTLIYWLSILFWDAVSFIVPTMLLLVTFFILSIKSFLDEGNWVLVVVVIGTYVWAILPCIYTFHFCFKTPSAGLATTIILNLFTVLLSDILVFEFAKPTSQHKEIGETLNYVFTVLFPGFNLSQCFGFILTRYISVKECYAFRMDCNNGISSICCMDHPELCYSSIPDSKCIIRLKTYLDFDNKKGIGRYLAFMVLQGIFFSLLVLAIEFDIKGKLAKWCKNKRALDLKKTLSMGDDEDDVVAEKKRILTTPLEELYKTDSLILYNLCKKYDGFPAVKHISVGVPEKECFGLLGQSGAGKTTTFKMLTGETSVTEGNAYLKGYDVQSSLRSVQREIGYCPQSDALIEELTAVETLTMYARLRGIPEGNIPDVVSNLIEMVTLEPHANKICGSYSGGNKRKLSLAMALVGDPPFIFLDEPSTGMDPKSRRQMWNVLTKIRDCGRTLVLSSHSMEECDAVCTRLAIMLQGRFTCIGSPQHLKNKYGQGYTLIIKMGTLPNGFTAKTEPVVEYIQRFAADTTVFDDHLGYIHLQVSDTNIEVADVFQIMEDCKKNLNVEDYSVHETTLEQIFLTFAKLQKLEDEVKMGMCMDVFL
ncbi:phospholipid-transporting ATPase ABCA1-like [Physella acuta]|uniref:phospholipid-transporting ATPase ABCA1-like n=1 Tax=Physella acuta TaxID=109671 RepID=UPI0027DEA8BB|nr:phospholipid-transporting ATPase ABCA1-like [Physella acuta]